MTPNVEKHNPDPYFIQKLVDRIDIPKRQIAIRLGISENHIYAVMRTPEKGGKKCGYLLQFALEVLAKNHPKIISKNP